MKFLYKFSLLLVAFICFSCSPTKETTSTKTTEKVIPSVSFEVNLTDRSNDTYKVEVTPPSLTAQNNIFQFAATAPGTYQVMDMGRYVQNFTAYNEKGEVVPTSKISTNQYELSTPESITKITYEISETWDTPVDRDQIYMMCGTSIEDDHSLINGQAVFGYFKGKQQSPIKIKLDLPEGWNYGTALTQNPEGYFFADNYDHAVDSPILVGNLTKASMDVQGTTVDIYTYSKTGKVNSEQILGSMKNMLLSASGFLNGLPVDRYTFLFHFEDYTNGAWEHSYSSEYVYKEDSWNNLEQGVLEVAAHEFFHVVTPLNIHSEIIEKFNFITPVPSEHLWLYEGTTEWAAHMMLLRSRQKSLDDYLNTLEKKVMISTRYYDSSISLVDLALKSYTPEGHKQYGNIYMKGALVAGLLDIKLIELSDGQTGLVDVINKLAKQYGPHKPFKEDTFFNVFVEETYPEIRQFIDNYIKASQPLPLKEYYEKIGIEYNPETNSFSVNSAPSDQQLKLRNKWKQKIEI
ncbi:M61 family metallopeptidase [Mangrovimonas aestuarii]|uniref:M61 family metallopeptidase n=1 Tax=Mangrovimonas aestuarii TaxID=3018443 RepID=UPI002378B0C7|nr:hypothetical protein [Mangrovimonas aestuarii]